MRSAILLNSVCQILEVILDCTPNQKVMQTFRHLMAVGMGTVIALSNMSSALSQTEPSRDRPETQAPDTHPHQSDLLAVEENQPVAPPEVFVQPEPVTKTHPDEVQVQRTTGTNRVTFEHSPATERDRVSQIQPTPRVEDPPPTYLNPSPNPLQFPTKPEEVEIVGTEPLTLEQTLDLAQRNSQDLQEALLNLERSQAALREARSALYPNLDVRSNLTRSNSANAELSNERQRERFGDNAVDQDEGNSSLDGTVELSYNLYTSGRRPAQIQISEGQVRLNELEVERIAAQLRFDVTDAYYNLQESDDQVRISRSAVESSQRSLRDAEALERAGLGTRFDVLRARVQLAQSAQDLTQALAQQRIRRRELARLLNVSQVVDISAAEPVEIAGLWNLSLEQSILLALRNRAELEQQLVQREISDQQRRLALSGLGPQVSLFANYNLLEIFDDDLGVADGYALGGRLQWSLYDGGAARARAIQEEKNIEVAETRFADLRNQIRLQVEQAYFNLQSNFENIQTANVAVDQARESLRLARLRFQAGVGTQSDVLDAETELTSAENRRLRAIVTYNRALASMERAITNLGGDYVTEFP